MNLFIKQKQTNRHRNKLVVTEGERGRNKFGVWDYGTHNTFGSF